MSPRVCNRKGVAVVENAVVLPLFLLLLIGFVIMALGVFRYQEIASLAREAARYASVRGDRYSMATGNNPASPQEIFENAIKPNAFGLAPEHLNYSVTWYPDKRQNSLVTVTITYRWIPEAFFGGMDISSTSVMQMSF